MNGFFTELEASHLFKAACLTRPRESLFFAFSHWGGHICCHTELFYKDAGNLSIGHHPAWQAFHQLNHLSVLMYFLVKFSTLVIKYVDKYIMQIITEKLLKMAIIFLTCACKFYEWKGKLS